MKNKLSPAVVCGFGAAVLSTVPGIKTFGCCILLPAATVLSLYFYLRITGFSQRITTKTALLMGFITGITSAFFALLFEVLSTYIFRSNDFVVTLPQVEIALNTYDLGAIGKETIAILRQMGKEITMYGFSSTYTFFLLFNNVIVDTIFGIIGGLIGLSIFNKKYFSNT